MHLLISSGGVTVIFCFSIWPQFFMKLFETLRCLVSLPSYCCCQVCLKGCTKFKTSEESRYAHTHKTKPNETKQIVQTNPVQKIKLKKINKAKN